MDSGARFEKAALADGSLRARAGDATMLLWEYLAVPERDPKANGAAITLPAPQSVRLPYDTRCAALTKSGHRCKGRVLPERECCFCHDPESIAKRQASGRRSKHRSKLSRLPDGYLRKITNRRSVGEAMDRLYREIRLGIITPDMGRVLFGILTRLLDSGLSDGNETPRAPQRSKAARIRPKIQDLLTRADRRAWNRAVSIAPPTLFDDDRQPVERNESAAMRAAAKAELVAERALAMPLQPAS